MPRKKKGELPSLRHHRGAQQGVVTLNGHDHYLGRWPAEQKEPPPEVRAAYDRMIAEWLAAGRREPVAVAQAPAGVSVAELILAFWRFAEGHYLSPDGEPTGSLENYRHALRALRELYGGQPAAEFSPLKLKALQRHLIQSGLCRTEINHRVGRVRRLFRWGVSEEMVPETTYRALLAVQGLQKGRSGARESEPVEPVADEIVERTIPRLNREVAGMVRLQRLTGMRPGEVRRLRASQIDRCGAVWVYRPRKHKTAHHGKPRVVCIGPRAQEVLLPFLRVCCPLCGVSDRPHRIGWRSGLCGPCSDQMDDADTCGPWALAPVAEDYTVFTPRDAERDRALALRARRKTKVQPSQQNRRKAKRQRPPGETYPRQSYINAVYRACDRAFPLPEHLAPKKLDTGRRETRAAWWARLTAQEKDEVRAWRQQHRWHPNQLRHSHGTEVRRLYGLEAAQVALGHARADVTQVYAERDLSLAERVAREIG
jgi:integrase